MHTATAIESNTDHPKQILEILDHVDDGIEQPQEINVLVIEDDETDFRITSKTLQLLDTYRAHAYHASDLVEARRMVREIEFDVVLVDFCLGDDTGTRAIQELGGRIGAAALILLTGMPGQDIRQIALKAGAIHCLDKNQLNPVLLETTIRSALHTHSLEASLQDVIIELELANRSKTDFFARMGHDLKTPLNAVLGYAQMINERSFGINVDEKYVGCAENICVAGTHLREVLDNLIHHAASQGSYSGSRFQSADINELTTQALAMSELLAATRKHKLNVTLSEDDVCIDCQAPVITQAILNIVSNAIKYTPDGGSICVSVTVEGRFAEIQVQDNGIGMSNDDIDVALSPFGRVDLPPEYAQDGTGIGLPIVRDIVRAHGGQLEIDSEPGKGTLMKIRLPRNKLGKSAA